MYNQEKITWNQDPGHRDAGGSTASTKKSCLDRARNATARVATQITGGQPSFAREPENAGMITAGSVSLAPAADD